jgi:integrase
VGTIIKRGERWRAVVRKKGHKVRTKTFKKKALANTWITDTEANLERRVVLSNSQTLGGVLDKYRTEVIEKRTFQTKVHFHLKRFAVDFEDIDFKDMSPEWWVNTAQSWKVSPQSCKRYLSVITGALSSAETLWDTQVNWPPYKKARALLVKLGVVAKSKPRVRRLRPGELEKLKAAISSLVRMPISDIIDLMLELGLREAEVCRLTWADLQTHGKQPMIWVRNRKHPKEKIGNDWNIPLLGTSYAIIKRQKRVPDQPRIFPWCPGSIGEAFRRLTDASGIIGLHLHDLRHEAISRLFEQGFQIQEVALVSGHLDWASLKIYTNIAAEDLHRGPAGGKKTKSREQVELITLRAEMGRMREKVKLLQEFNASLAFPGPAPA